MSTVSERIWKLIPRWGKQIDAVESLDISPQYLNDICQGRQQFSVTVAVAIERSLRESELGWSLLVEQLREQYDKEKIC